MLLTDPEQDIHILRSQWEEDCQKLIPEFELLDEDRMFAELENAKQVCGMTDCTDLEVIVHVLRNLDEDKGGVPAAWWWIMACLEIMPNIESHPWFEVVWWAYQDMRGKRWTNTLWGSASCGKTEVFAAMALTSMVVWHGDAHVYISSPAKNAGKDKIWEAASRWIKLWSEKPPLWASLLGLTFDYVNDLVTIIDQSGRKSTMSFVSLETTAGVTGKKRAREGGQKFNPRKGVMMLIGDELIISPAACRKFLEGEGNYMSNSNFMGWVAMNPLPEQVRHANAMPMSEPTEIAIENLNEHIDFSWKTQRGRLFRLCMANSPNRFNETPIFDFLINHEQANAATIRGEDNYKAQVAAWGWSDGMGNGGVLSLDGINRERNQAAPVWTTPQVRWAFFDLAFGGRDPAGYCCMEHGTALSEGVEKPVISGVDQQKLHVMRTWKPNEKEVAEFIRMAKERGGKAPESLIADVELDANHHMVYQVLKKSSELGVKRGYVSFDSSLRPDVTLMAVNALGHVPWFYSGSRKLKEEEAGWPLYPPEMIPGKDKRQVKAVWSDKHAQPISAAWRFAEHIIARGHVFGLTRLRKGLMELISRMWVSAPSGKSDVAAKQTLSVSPWAGETLCLALEFGVRFCGALPQLGKEKPLVTAGVPEPEAFYDMFKIQSRRPSSTMWTK